ncbi:Hypothetical protein SCF082_LOCUS42472 [Durusdinium trenchii]|uniref:Uncharacterized protein n=1 Tax=Durusdinium trenchii TaxID=1381693 RepID=A0ABP0QSX7_9DINO
MRRTSVGPPREVLRELARTEQVMRFKGVSLARIRAVLDEVRSGTAAPGVGVVVAKRDLADDDDVEERPREQWTIADVCDFVIIPSVTEGSTTRHYAVRDCGTTFLWLDLFCANQPKLLTEDEIVAEERAALLTSGFHFAIEWFDERLFFFDLWSKPKPLTRAWCIWEIFGVIQADKPMTVIRLEKRTSSLRRWLNVVETSAGWSRLKTMVLAQVLAWLHEATERLAEYRLFLRKALETYQRCLDIEVAAYGTENHLKVARTLSNVALCLEELGDVTRAQDQARKALHAWQATLPRGPSTRRLGLDA